MLKYGRVSEKNKMHTNCNRIKKVMICSHPTTDKKIAWFGNVGLSLWVSVESVE